MYYFLVNQLRQGAWESPCLDFDGYVISFVLGIRNAKRTPRIRTTPHLEGLGLALGLGKAKRVRDKADKTERPDKTWQTIVSEGRKANREQKREKTHFNLKREKSE
jgi:hypothetical protein